MLFAATIGVVKTNLGGQNQIALSLPKLFRPQIVFCKSFQGLTHTLFGLLRHFPSVEVHPQSFCKLKTVDHKLSNDSLN